ncbi:MAG TPA: hypothetical protein VFB63_33165 [Bryobacteraceae bacterium]|jgi:hypothetical protein|nr:hypothetical protein [Bryobacteraceae bacterium]
MFQYAAWLRPVALPAFCLALCLMLPGCGAGGSASQSAVRQMGERIQVGPLIYTILEADWQNELPGEASPRLPQHKFLMIRATVTNSGSREVNMPLLHLVDDANKQILESDDGKGVEEWFGLYRAIKPADTLPGRFLFDAKPGNYKLLLSDGGDLEREITALVSIPLRLKEYEKFEPGVVKKDGE